MLNAWVHVHEALYLNCIYIMTPRVQDLSINRSYELVYKTNGKSLTMSSQCQLHAPFTMYTAAPSMYV